MVTIRKMTMKDREEVLHMMRVFYDSPAVAWKVDSKILEQDFSDAAGDNPLIDGFVFTESEAEDAKILGYAMTAMCYATEFGGLCVWLEDLYLKPEARGHGIAKQFFPYLESYYPQAVRYKLEVETENEAAIAVYKREGYGVSPYFVMTKEM